MFRITWNRQYNNEQVNGYIGKYENKPRKFYNITVKNLNYYKYNRSLRKEEEREKITNICTPPRIRINRKQSTFFTIFIFKLCSN